MLVLSRMVGEQIVVPSYHVTLTVLEIKRQRVRLGISAPPDVAIHREEVHQKILAENNRDGERRLKSLRILIAESDGFLLKSYGRYLRQRGVLTATAKTGLDCTEQVRRFEPHVLILRAFLPWGGADGVLALFDECPRIRPEAVILLGDGCDRKLLYELSRFHVDDCPIKPLKAEELAERIHRLLPPRMRDVVTPESDSIL